jgi:hypothetical protein
MRLPLSALAVVLLVLLVAPVTAAAAGDTNRAALRVEITVASRCVVAAAPGGETTVRCTRGTAAPAIGTPRGPEPLELERAAAGHVTASAIAPASGAGTNRVVTIQF